MCLAYCKCFADVKYMHSFTVHKQKITVTESLGEKSLKFLKYATYTYFSPFATFPKEIWNQYGTDDDIKNKSESTNNIVEADNSESNAESETDGENELYNEEEAEELLNVTLNLNTLNDLTEKLR